MGAAASTGRLREGAKYYDKRPDAWNGAQDCVDLGSSGGFAVVANQMRLCASRAGRSLWAAGTAVGERALRRHKPQFGAQNRVPGDRTGRADSLIVVFRPLPQTTRSNPTHKPCDDPAGLPTHSAGAPTEARRVYRAARAVAWGRSPPRLCVIESDQSGITPWASAQARHSICSSSIGSRRSASA